MPIDNGHQNGNAQNSTNTLKAGQFVWYLMKCKFLLVTIFLKICVCFKRKYSKCIINNFKNAENFVLSKCLEEILLLKRIITSIEINYQDI